MCTPPGSLLRQLVEASMISLAFPVSPSPSLSLSFIFYKIFPGYSHSTAVSVYLSPCICLPANKLGTCSPQGLCTSCHVPGMLSLRCLCVCSLTCFRSFLFRVPAGDGIHSQCLNERGRRSGRMRDGDTLRSNSREVFPP